MKANLRVIGLSLALTAGLLLVSGAAWAQASKTPIEGEWVACRNFSPEREWVDEDGIGHVRDQGQWCEHKGDIIGRGSGWRSYDVDWAAGLSSGHGYLGFVGTVLGEPAKAVGRFTWECDRIEGTWICTNVHVWHVNDGSLIKFSGISDGVFPTPFSGIHLDPPGRN